MMMVMMMMVVVMVMMTMMMMMVMMMMMMMTMTTTTTTTTMTTGYGVTARLGAHEVAADRARRPDDRGVLAGWAEHGGVRREGEADPPLRLILDVHLHRLLPRRPSHVHGA